MGRADLLGWPCLSQALKSRDSGKSARLALLVEPAALDLGGYLKKCF